MQRKIIQQSPTTLGISLPFRWAKYWSIKRGDTVNININKGILEVVPTSYAPPERKAEIDAQLYGKLTRRVFDNISKMGYDEIRVDYDEEKDLDPIKETLKVEATMFEIIKKEKDYIIAKSVYGINRDELNNIINRLVFVLIEMANKVMEYLENQDPQILCDLVELEKTNNRLSHMCMRAIHKQPMEENSFVRYTMVWAIEKLGNDFKFFAASKPEKMKDDTKKALISVMESIKLLCEIFFKYDTKKAVIFYDKRKRVNEHCIQSLGNKANAGDHYLMHTAISINEKSLYLLGLLFGLTQRNQEGQ